MSLLNHFFSHNQCPINLFRKISRGLINFFLKLSPSPSPRPCHFPVNIAPSLHRRCSSELSAMGDLLIRSLICVHLKVASFSPLSHNTVEPSNYDAYVYGFNTTPTVCSTSLPGIFPLPLSIVSFVSFYHAHA